MVCCLKIGPYVFTVDFDFKAELPQLLPPLPELGGSSPLPLVEEVKYLLNNLSLVGIFK